MAQMVTVALIAGIVTAAVELAGLIMVAQLLGTPLMLLLVLVTGLVGSWLFRREGVRGWRAFRSCVDQGRPPGPAVADGLVGVVAAIGLIVPGFLTDAVGLLLLVRPVRALAAGGVRRLAERRWSPATVGGMFGPRRVRPSRRRKAESIDTAGVLDGEIVDE